MSAVSWTTKHLSTLHKDDDKSVLVGAHDNSDLGVIAVPPTHLLLVSPCEGSVGSLYIPKSPDSCIPVTQRDDIVHTPAEARHTDAWHYHNEILIASLFFLYYIILSSDSHTPPLPQIVPTLRLFCKVPRLEVELTLFSSPDTNISKGLTTSPAGAVQSLRMPSLYCLDCAISLAFCLAS